MKKERIKKAVLFLVVLGLSISFIQIMPFYALAGIKGESAEAFNIITPDVHSDESLVVGDAESRKSSVYDSVYKLKSAMTDEEKKISGDLLKLVDTKYLLSSQSRKDLIKGMQERKQYRPASVLRDATGGKQTGEMVYVYIYLKDNVDINYADSLLQDISDRDPDNQLLTAWIEVNQLINLASLEGVRTIRTVLPPKINAGSKTSEGVTVERAAQVLSRFGQNGSGVKVGVISDGVDHWTQSRNMLDLPANLHVLSNSQGGDEGTAMLEIVHDMAPGAELYFHDCGANMIAFNSAIDDLVASGCNVIVDDIGWLAEPFFEDGIVAKHVANVLANNNIIYISAAGNDADCHYQGTYYADEYDLHDFNGSGSGEESLYVDIPKGASVLIVLQWDDQFGASGNDYDLFLVDEDSWEIVAASGFPQDGSDDPLEVIEYTNNTDYYIDGQIWVENYEGNASTRTLELFVYTEVANTLHSDNLTPADSIYGHPAVPGVIAVGAVGQASPSAINDYSSLGPVTIRYPSPSIRNKPDLVAVDGVSVTGVGGFGSPFYGTSASAPHVAGIAALTWAQFPTKTDDQISSIIKNTAVDLGSTTGWDKIYGYGRADAMNAFMSEIANCVFSSAVLKKGGVPVAITSSGHAANELWFAPAGTTNFVEGTNMTRAAGNATSILTPAVSGTYKMFVRVEGKSSTPSTASLSVDALAPTNQNTVFSVNQTKKGGVVVSIASSGDGTNQVWLAPAGTTNFLAGPQMTKAVNGTATTILAPATEGAYRLYIIDAVGNVSLPSAAVLTVDNTPPSNQDSVFAMSMVVKGGAPVGIADSGDAANSIWFAPINTTVFTIGPTMTKGVNGLATTTLAPSVEGSYRLYVIDAAGNMSSASTATLTVDNTPPVNADNYPRIEKIDNSTENVRIKTNENGKAYYVVLEDNGEVPSAYQIKAGTDAANNSIDTPYKGIVDLDQDIEMQITITGLNPSKSYHVHIVAEDRAENLQTAVATLDIATGTIDQVLPTWASDSTILANIGAGEVSLSWSGATDDIGVVWYRVYMDGNMLSNTIKIGSPLYIVNTLAPNQTYTFKIEAGDAYGNWSTDGPSRTITTFSSGDLTAGMVAGGIMFIQSPTVDDESLILPKVPEGFLVTIKSSDKPNIIDILGKITTSDSDTDVLLYLEVTKISDNTKVETGGIVVHVPAKSTVDECFIATASFGSKFEPCVVLLREFRDRLLLTNQYGTEFVKFYYRHSPPIARFIADSEILKLIVRVLLTPLIAVVYLILHPLLGTMILAVVLPLFFMWLRKKDRLLTFPF